MITRRDKLIMLFEEIDFECGYYPMIDSGEMGIFDYLSESEMDIDRVIMESIEEIKNDTSIKPEYKNRIINILLSELC